MKRLAVLLACLAGTACSHAAPGLLEQIKTLAAEGSCDSSQQCRTLPLGAKSCGGPEAYLAYSTRRDAAQLAALAERYRKQRVAENEKSGMASDCRLMTDPGAVCRAGRCQTGGAAAE